MLNRLTPSAVAHWLCRLVQIKAIAHFSNLFVENNYSKAKNITHIYTIKEGLFLQLQVLAAVDCLHCHPSRSCQAVPSLFGVSLEAGHPQSVRSISVIFELGPWLVEPPRASQTPRTPPMRSVALSYCVCMCVFILCLWQRQNKVLSLGPLCTQQYFQWGLNRGV